MIVRIIKLAYVKLLLFFCAISIAQASSFYDLKEGIAREFDGPELRDLSFTRHAHIASEDFRFSGQFLDQTRKMMERESVFRHKCSIAEGTNVAQLCIYGTYRDTPDWKFIEIFDPRSCKGHFYLSGNDPVTLPFAQEKKSGTSSSIDVQKISHEKGYIEVRQRPQPLLIIISDTVQFLERIGDFVENPTPEAVGLAKQAAAKNREIIELTEKKNQIIKEIDLQARQLEESRGAPDTLIHSTNTFMIGIIRELITCLEVNDFNFNEMKDARNNANLRDLISSIQRRLSARNLSELLYSKYFNLGCSEPLLLFDLLREKLSKFRLVRDITNTLFSEKLDSIVVQLHSTKTPCRSCLIGCCGHHLHGIIRSFFDDVLNAVRSSLKRDDVKLRFLISYHAPYEDEYPFYVPIAQDLSYAPHSILLVNMQLYDEQYRRMKERIIREERLKIAAVLSRKLKERQGTLTTGEIAALGLLK